MKKLSAVVLIATIVASVSVMFIEDKWVSTLSEVATCALAAAWMLVLAFGRYEVTVSSVLWPISFVLIWGLTQVLFGWTVYRWSTWLSLLYWLANLSVLFVGIQTFDEARLRERFLRWLVLFGFGAAVLGSLQALTTNAKIYWTFETKYAGWVVMGPFVYHNQYAAFIELLLPIALYSAVSDKAWRWFYLLIVATMYASIFIAGSRAGFILTTLELAVVPMALIGKRRIPWLGLASAGALLIGMVVLLALSAGPEYLFERFLTKDPYAVRREFVGSSVEMFRSRPLTGVGLGNWPTAYPEYALFDDGFYANQAHNDWAQWAVEGGFPMLAMMFGTAVWIFPRALRSGWGCGAAAIFLHCFVDYPIQRPAVALVFFSIIAAISHSELRRRNSFAGSTSFASEQVRNRTVLAGDFN